MTAFVEGWLSEDVRLGIEQHLSCCPTCRREAQKEANLAKALVAPDPVEHTGTWHRPSESTPSRRWVLLAPAFAIAAATLGLFLWSTRKENPRTIALQPDLKRQSAGSPYEQTRQMLVLADPASNPDAILLLRSRK